MDESNVERVARIFVDSLASDLGEGKMRVVAERNRRSSPSVCATGDFCDSNEWMADAIGQVTGECDTSLDETVYLWNAAWNRAKELIDESFGG